MNRIYTAEQGDKAEILSLYRTFLHGPADWNEYYPNEDTIDFDISRNALFVMKNDAGQIIAAISVDKDEDVDKLSCWNSALSPAAEFSRLCVRRDMQGQGLARQLIAFVLERFTAEGKKSAHILVKTGHSAALSLYSAIGFETVGECTLFGKDFICMELAL
ncbi:MAG: GNAT family N-acetyltransferase [Oscillospiraceae bacterium]